ncbi:MAG: hypothetical protein C0467_06180 [Planctomycetaceae bacterium]|nr:hypothetical protein [Planctomycetaceae bacterium]
MRLVFAIALVSGSMALAQPPKDPDLPKEIPARFGIPPKVKAYPQDSAKKTLLSAIEAIEKGDTTYIVAHLLDPGFVEFRVADRAKQFEAPAEIELSRLRDFQIRNPEKYPVADRLPTDRAKFAALIIERSREQAFKQLVRDVQSKLMDDPLSIKDLQKLLRDGMVTDTETGAKLTHADVKDKALYFRKIDDRWFLENRQEDIPAPVVPPPKKEGM